tara:strand:- start:462 stop:662 length:201 start_codon:yes stop_codon:yes gene_type:complete
MAVLGQEAQKQKQSQKSKSEEIRLSVKDTDFILKNLMQSTFQGSDVEQAYKVMKKISELHRRNLES